MPRPLQDVILVTLPDKSAAAVILNGRTIYHEDSDKGHSQNFEAYEVAERLADALGIEMKHIELTWAEVGDTWNFDDLQTIALEKEGVVTVPSNLQLLRQAVIDYAKNKGFRNPERFPETLILQKRESLEENNVTH